MSKVTPRELVLNALLEIDKQGASLDEVLPSIYDADLSPQDKAFARGLLMVTLRHAGQLEALLAAYMQKLPTGKLLPVRWMLQMGAVQLCVLETPAHAAIDTTVQLCKSAGFKHQSGLVNAVLRKVAQEQPALPDAMKNLPKWLEQSWRKTYGAKALKQMAQQFTQEPPLDLSFKQESEIGEAMLPLSHRTVNQDITQLEGYSDGAFWVQDVAATIPARLLGDIRGKKVLDLCAAPGGKTLQLAAAGAKVTAIDRSASRLKRLQENLERTALAAEIVEADLTQWQPQGAADAVLLDAPCSATGTVRRHPDLLLRKTQKDVAEMADLQRAILTQIMRWLPADVPFIYCVCSLQPEEGELQIQWLLQTYPEMRVEQIQQPDWPREWMLPDGTLRLLPHYWADRGGMDGFFIAKLRKTA